MTKYLGISRGNLLEQRGKTIDAIPSQGSRLDEAGHAVTFIARAGLTNATATTSPKINKCFVHPSPHSPQSHWNQPIWGGGKRTIDLLKNTAWPST
jgi:hypothetical protein